MTPTSPGEILQLIREQRVATRRDIIEVTGLSRVTVTQRVEALRTAGLLYEAGPDESTGGRRPARLRVNYEHGIVLTGVLDTSHAELSATNLAGFVMAHRSEPITVSDGPAPVLDEVLAGFGRLLRKLRRPSAVVDGIGISVPGPVNPETARSSQPPLMPGWDDYGIIEHLSRAYDVPMVVENDANATALGEQVSHHPEAGALCLIKVSTGIGCGIVVNGRVVSGVDGGAGDIGHIRLDGHDALCTCGNRGCLAAVAGGVAVAARITEAGTPVGSVAEVRRLLDAGDVVAEQVTREAGRLIGRTASMLNSVLNPGVMVVTGDLASAPLLAGIQESIYEFSLPRATRNLRVTLGGLGDSAAQFGLSRMVADRMFDPQAIDTRVGYA